MVWRRWRRRSHGTLSPLVHGLSVVLLRGCLRVGARALLEGCSKVAAAVCSVLHWCLARIMCSFSRGLCLGPHLRSQPRHAWPFRRARFVGPYVRPSLYSAVLVPASAAMWRCCECWLDSMQRACFPLPGVVSTPHVGWWPSKSQKQSTPVCMVVFRPVAVVCHSLSGGECCDPSRTDHVISVRQVDVSEDRLWACAHNHETTPLVVITIFTQLKSVVNTLPLPASKPNIKLPKRPPNPLSRNPSEAE